MASEWIFKKGDEGLILAAQEQALRTNSIKHSVDRPHRHHCVDYVENPLKQCGTLSVDARSLPRMSIGSATTGWPCGYTGRCVGNME